MVIRRIFSISGFIPLFYFIMHLSLYFTSSFWIIDESKYFFWLMNLNSRIFGNLYLETFLIFIPLSIHILIGLRYMLIKSYLFHSHTSYTLRKANVFQRLTAWILLLTLTFHVIQMRLINHPHKTKIENNEYFAIKIKPSNKIYKIAEKLNIKIFENGHLYTKDLKNDSLLKKNGSDIESYSHKDEKIINASIPKELYSLDPKKTYALTTEPSMAFLIMIINNFQSRLIVFIYTIFVLVASFHGFNGLWMFLIYFKVLRTHQMKINVLKLCFLLMFIFSIMGLTPIWINFLDFISF